MELVRLGDLDNDTWHRTVVMPIGATWAECVAAAFNLRLQDVAGLKTVYIMGRTFLSDDVAYELGLRKGDVL